LIFTKKKRDIYSFKLIEYINIIETQSC